MDHPIIVANRQKNLYFADKRIIFFPKGWCDDFKDMPDDGPAIWGWYGNPDVLNFQEREGKEYLTTDAQGWFYLKELEGMRQVDEAEARRIDPDLFTLLDAVRNGEAV
jgi:hypothetical protein